jgi:hypothetical protein
VTIPEQHQGKVRYEPKASFRSGALGDFRYVIHSSVTYVVEFDCCDTQTAATRNRGYSVALLVLLALCVAMGRISTSSLTVPLLHRPLTVSMTLCCCRCCFCASTCSGEDLSGYKLTTVQALLEGTFCPQPRLLP